MVGVLTEAATEFLQPGVTATDYCLLRYHTSQFLRWERERERERE
jgi:hypothetical protein